MNHRTPDEIINADLYFIDRIGLKENPLAHPRQRTVGHDQTDETVCPRIQKQNTMTTPQEIMRIEQDIVLTLKNIYDPEIPVNIYDLGLVYEIDVEPDGTANIRMTLTAPNCPMADQLLEQVNDMVGKVKGVTSVNVILTFDPPWDKSMMSEETLLDLGLL